ncbi:hypothetical protein CLV35_0252 [Motilibacter peucedani]|uniref:Uncharacterized protein n=1 Tax=Motilibacter peucedani TaxID=598650 RepID=A0A420XUX3_9ACTN|nr:hypothetical protein [Motilibacter peucedani]RKS80662.1 hypothetical protein CLV35_0252 [Motilibacter peucedani]
MADSKSARRDAERAAQALLENTMVKAAGELGAASATRADATVGVDSARTRGAELISDAQRQADQLVADAQASVTAAEATYAAAWKSALAAGWTPDALTNLGHTVPSRPTRARSGRRAAASEPSSTDASGESPAEQDGASGVIDDVA